MLLFSLFLLMLLLLPLLLFIQKSSFKTWAKSGSLVVMLLFMFILETYVLSFVKIGCDRFLLLLYRKIPLVSLAKYVSSYDLSSSKFIVFLNFFIDNIVILSPWLPELQPKNCGTKRSACYCLPDGWYVRKGKNQ